MMGLHQKITDRTTSEPCDCGSDDDHSAVLMDNPEAIQLMFDEAEEAPLDSTMPDDVWTDGNE